MRLSLSFFLFMLAVPATVFACEGECIVEITKAFLSNYTLPMNIVMENLAREISMVIPSRPPVSTTATFLRPIMDVYNSNAYAGMENAIFPSYFHGKCLIDGVEPDGCPNPDCPMVCGTPGSLVHFYPKLRYIAFNQTRHILKGLAAPGTDTYNQVEQYVLDYVNSPPARRLVRGYPPEARSLHLGRRQNDIKTQLKDILSSFGPKLEYTCGGTGDGETNGLPACSWENAMKEYILTFP